MDAMMAIQKSEISEQAALLQPEDIEKLVDWLALKEDDIRYQAFLLLQARSRLDSGVYPYWEEFRIKLSNENSYQRSLGIMLIAENVQWDVENKMQAVLADYLRVLQDEKPVTVRQCIQGLRLIAEKEPRYNREIAEALVAYDIMSARETMRKSILLDILNALLEIRKSLNNAEINTFIMNALSGDILDKKSKKAIESQL
jgi:hypothetical protein